jgi:IS605 OrfB family transposase
MRRTVCVRLTTTPHEEALLTETLVASRDCFNTVAEHGWTQGEKNGVALHRATYYPLRAKHPALPAQLVIAARMKATEALKSAFARRNKGQKVSAPTSERGGVRFDARTYRIELDQGIVGLSMVGGRIKLPFHAHRHATRWLDRASGFASADLVLRPSGWWLNVVLTIVAPEIVPSGKVKGVDLGINRPAVTSDAEFLGRRRWKEIEQRYFRLIRRLQAKGTKSATRHLKKLRHRRARFRRDCDHVLSRQIVQSAGPGDVIAVEHLTEIRHRTRQRGRQQRRRHHAWSYAQLRAFVTYKAEDRGCPVVAVDPRKTSQRCCRCGHEHRRNRPTQSVFRCRRCGFELNADLNAARNIAWKYLAGIGMPDPGGQHVNLPIVGEGCSHLSTHKLAPSGPSC